MTPAPAAAAGGESVVVSAAANGDVSVPLAVSQDTLQPGHPDTKYDDDDDY